MDYQFLRFPGGRFKAFTVSYDDGCAADLRLAETLDRYEVKGTFNMMGRAWGTALSDQQVREKILDKGHEVAVHGLQHKAPGLVRPVDGIRDVLECRMELEEHFGRIIRGYAYPDSGITRWSNGSDLKTVKTYLKDLGIAYARTLNGDNNRFELPSDWYEWTPTMHHDNPRSLQYAEEFAALELNDGSYCAARQPRLFYMWGHSYEFERKQNWNHLEEILRKTALRDDTWYATNIQIHDYVEAYNSLLRSTDGKRICNPTVYEIWLEQNGKPYQIRPGETIVLQ